MGQVVEVPLKKIKPETDWTESQLGVELHMTTNYVGNIFAYTVNLK
jgi:hypothetical protein